VLVALTVSALMLASLAVIHPIAELAIIAFVPALVAHLFAGGVRSRYVQYVKIGVLASAFSGAAWLIGSAGAEENVIGMLIAAGVASCLMLVLGAAGAFVFDAAMRRRARLS
jgi:hypothetical protein